MKAFDQAHPLNIKDEDIKEIDDGEEKEEGEEAEKKEEKKPKQLKLTNEEEELVQEYEKLLNKIYTAFKLLYIFKTKKDFIDFMKKKGVPQHNDSKSNLNKSLRTKGKKITKKIKTEKIYIKTEETENKKNDDAEEEEDIRKYDPDTKILKTFIKEQKKEVDEFINVKKQPTKPAPATNK